LLQLARPQQVAGQVIQPAGPTPPAAHRAARCGFCIIPSAPVKPVLRHIRRHKAPTARTRSTAAANQAELSGPCLVLPSPPCPKSTHRRERRSCCDRL
jgi:hypothetical protein